MKISNKKVSFATSKNNILSSSIKTITLLMIRWGHDFQQSLVQPSQYWPSCTSFPLPFSHLTSLMCWSSHTMEKPVSIHYIHVYMCVFVHECLNIYAHISDRLMVTRARPQMLVLLCGKVGTLMKILWFGFKSLCWDEMLSFALYLQKAQTQNFHTLAFYAVQWHQVRLYFFQVSWCACVCQNDALLLMCELSNTDIGTNNKIIKNITRQNTSYCCNTQRFDNYI